MKIQLLVIIAIRVCSTTRDQVGGEFLALGAVVIGFSVCTCSLCDVVVLSVQKQKVDGDSSTKKGSRKSTEGSDADESGKGDEDDSLEEEEIEKKRLTFKDDSEEEDQESVEEREKSAKKSKELKVRLQLPSPGCGVQVGRLLFFYVLRGFSSQFEFTTRLLHIVYLHHKV